MGVKRIVGNDCPDTEKKSLYYKQNRDLSDRLCR